MAEGIYIHADGEFALPDFCSCFLFAKHLLETKKKERKPWTIVDGDFDCTCMLNTTISVAFQLQSTRKFHTQYYIAHVPCPTLYVEQIFYTLFFELIS